MNKTFRRIFVERLEALLDRSGKSDAEIARNLGRSRSWLSNYRTGKYVPKTEELPRLAREIGCTVDELLGAKPLPPQPARVAERRQTKEIRCPHCDQDIICTVTRGRRSKHQNGLVALVAIGLCFGF